MNALFCNWWSVYARMIDLDTRREAKTSRPMMMDGVARVTRHGRQTTFVLTIAHSAAAKLRESFEEMVPASCRNCPLLRSWLGLSVGAGFWSARSRNTMETESRD